MNTFEKHMFHQNTHFYSGINISYLCLCVFIVQLLVIEVSDLEER